MSDPNQPPQDDPFAPPPEGQQGPVPTPPPPPAYGAPPPPPAYGAPPPPPAYGMPGAPPAYGAPVADVPNNMGLAIAALVAGLCCSGIIGLIFGILAVVNASSVKNKAAMGDIAGAQEAARKARLFSFITFGIAVVAVVVGIVLYSTGVLNTSLN